MGKRGPLSEIDKRFIAENFRTLTIREIAKRLDRDPKGIQKYIDRHMTKTGETLDEAEYDIKKSPVWKEIQKQFQPEELELFLFHYTNIISQFKNDVFPTEEMQIIDACKLEVSMNRSLTEQNSCINDIRYLESQVLEAKKVNDLETVHNLERQIAVLRAAQDSLNSNYKDMLDRKNKIFREMKATRDQRVKSLEAGKHNYMSWIKRILSNRELRRKLGIEMEKLRLSMNLEYERLSEYYQFGEDGDVDQPLLTPENILD